MKINNLYKKYKIKNILIKKQIKKIKNKIKLN